MLMIDDIEYVHDYPDSANKNLPLTLEKGREIGKVTYKMANRACMDHKMRNGDAAFLMKVQAFMK